MVRKGGSEGRWILGEREHIGDWAVVDELREIAGRKPVYEDRFLQIDLGMLFDLFASTKNRA